jgi:hypothetical protein
MADQISFRSPHSALQGSLCSPPNQRSMPNSYLIAQLLGFAWRADDPAAVVHVPSGSSIYFRVIKDIFMRDHALSAEIFRATGELLLRSQ